MSIIVTPPVTVTITDPQMVIVEGTRPIVTRGLTVFRDYYYEDRQSYFFAGFPDDNGGNCWWKPAGPVSFDFDLEGRYTIMELACSELPREQKIYINTRNGDLNFDGQVTISDFIDLASNFGQAGNWTNGDLNHDGIISISDFIDLASNIGQSTPNVGQLVPEPSLFFVLGLLLFTRKRKA